MVHRQQSKMDLFNRPLPDYYGLTMKPTNFAATGVLLVAITVLTSIQMPQLRAGEGAIPFPEGYRSWTFLHGSVVPAGFPGFSKLPCVKPCTNGIFYFYANELAMKGLRTGVYEDGAIIAEEMLELHIGEKGTGAEGRRVLTAVMVKDSHRFAATGGWGFGNYDEGSKVNTLDEKAQQTCFQCHTARKERGYVFTQFVER